MFAALGDPTRARLVGRLSEAGPQSIARLADGAGVSRQAVTKHLQLLEDVGLARSTRVGRERVWQIRPQRLARAQRHLQEISRQWDAALERLRILVED